MQAREQHFDPNPRYSTDPNQRAVSDPRESAQRQLTQTREQHFDAKHRIVTPSIPPPLFHAIRLGGEIQLMQVTILHEKQ